MDLSLCRARSLRTIFACLSIFVCVFIYFTMTNLSDQYGLHNVMKRKDVGHYFNSSTEHATRMMVGTTNSTPAKADNDSTAVKVTLNANDLPHTGRINPINSQQSPNKPKATFEVKGNITLGRITPLGKSPKSPKIDPGYHIHLVNKSKDVNSPKISPGFHTHLVEKSKDVNSPKLNPGYHTHLANKSKDVNSPKIIPGYHGSLVNKPIAANTAENVSLQKSAPPGPRRVLKAADFPPAPITLTPILQYKRKIRYGYSAAGASLDKGHEKPSGDVHGLPRCPRLPLGLIGDKTALTMDTVYEKMTFKRIAKENPHLMAGGRYAPRGCKAKHKVAIIIPMRGMERLLLGLLSHMHPIWQRQQLDYTVYVITQAGNELFNKGKLMNAGFMEARKDRPYDCFIFHDADLLLENDQCLYWCASEYTRTSSQVLHVSKLIDKFDYKLLQYRPWCMPKNFRDGRIRYFGGITSFSEEQFISINGFSNIYWGWGGEDDDAAMRVEKKGHLVRRFPECRFQMLKHDHVANGTNHAAIRMMNSAIDRQDIDGLSSLTYRVLSTSLDPLFTNITIDVGRPTDKLLQIIYNQTESRRCNGSVFMNPDTW